MDLGIKRSVQLIDRRLYRLVDQRLNAPGDVDPGEDLASMLEILHLVYIWKSMLNIRLFITCYDLRLGLIFWNHVTQHRVVNRVTAQGQLPERGTGRGEILGGALDKQQHHEM